MTFRWLLLFVLVSWCGIIPLATAQTVNNHTKKVSHLHHPTKTTVTSKHKATHRPHHVVINPIKRYKRTVITSHQHLSKSVERTSKNSASIQLASVAIPQPQFDTHIQIDSPEFTDTPAVSALTVNSPTPDDTTTEVDTSQQALTALAYKTVETKHYSTYKLGGTVFDPLQGIYKIDCSGYVDDLLSQANPQAYSNLTNATQTDKPTSHDYYKFISHLPDEATQYWHKVNSIEQLRPGGILVFLSEYLHRHHLYSGGHVMLVMSKPIPQLGSSDTFQVKVADSAPSGHSNDTRLPHKSGIGIGTLLLKVDPFTGRPKAYAWKLNDHWRVNTRFAMAEPMS